MHIGWERVVGLLKNPPPLISGKSFRVLKIQEERQGCYALYHILMRKKDYA